MEWEVHLREMADEKLNIYFPSCHVCFKQAYLDFEHYLILDKLRMVEASGWDDLLGGVDELLAAVALGGVRRVLSAQVLCHLSRRKLCLADISKVPGQVDCLS